MFSRSRRDFIGKATVAGSAFFATNQFSNVISNNMFVHHVYFWLKNPDSSDDKKKLIEGLRKLSKVKTIREFHIGQPAPTNRDVIDRSYSVSWMVLFENPSDQDSYQVDPIHLKFVEECSALWSKVVVYDSIDV